MTSFAVVRNGIIMSVHQEKEEAEKAAKYRDGVVITSQHTGIMSKRFKNRAWKDSKRVRHMENKAYRAGLHSEKACYGTGDKREPVQRKIDEISNRGVTN